MWKLEISKELGVSEEELVRKGIKAYLEMEFRRVNAEIYGIFSRYDVSSLSELDEKISKGKLSETETFDDFARLDYSESVKERIEKLLGVLG